MWMDKPTVISPNNGIGFSDGKKWAIKPWQDMENFECVLLKSLQMVTAAMKLKDAYSLEGKLWPT